ncbi:Integral membrane protein OS=Streptomyces antimycoticus OX=68175 GN=SSPO_033540 PE=4 SV=1 [Streptomyces antimycoticus]
MPGRLGGNPPGVVGGWALAALGLVLAGPGLTHLCGRLLAVGRPGVLRLLAGRMLQQEAGLIGRPVGALCALAAAGYTVLELYGRASGPSGAHAFGPLTGLGAALVTLCAAATTLTAVVEARSARERTTAALLRLGAPTRLLRGAAALRATALLALLVPLVWVVAHLTAMPFHR